MVPYLYTNSDAIQAMQDWAGFTGSPSADMLRKIKRAIDNAYRALVYQRDWTYYNFRGRINTAASYNTGTIAYTNSTRTVTLTGGTFPSNASLCTFRVGAADYAVVSATSTTLVLSVNSNPNQDIAAGTSYTLFQDTYPLPVNFARMGTLRDANRSRVLIYMAPNEFVGSRQIFQVPAIPFWYTMFGDRSYVGVNSISFYPPPDQFYQYDYMGLRQPRPFTQWIPYSTGTVTTSGTSVTGTGTLFTAQMVGCVLRFSGSIAAPTGTIGSNPYSAQRVVTSYSTATAITIDQALSADLSGVAYEISDPIDMDAGCMYTAFLRLCEWELAKLLNRDDVKRMEDQFRLDLRIALEADNRSSDDKPGGQRYWQRVADYTPLSDATT